MQNYLIFITGNLLSCIITSFIVFQYMNESYVKSYNNRAVYVLLQVIVNGCMLSINLICEPMINLVSWIVIFSVISSIFFNDYEKKIIRRIFEIVVLFLVLAVCETVGYTMLEFIIWKCQITYIQPLILQCLKVTFSKLSVLVLYYLFITRIWKTGKYIKLTSAQYMVYGLIIIYSILNLSLILISVSNISYMDNGKMILLMINIFGIVFVDLFFLYFTKLTEENGQLKLKLKLLEQQADIQYKYYVLQEEKYNESVNILHDVNKHLRMIEEIYETEKAAEAKEYTNAIQKILQPLIPQQYSKHPILDILLNDKKRCTVFDNIEFQVEIGNVDLTFMEPIEITTVFGNLLDNAIEACQKVKKNRYINLRLDTFNGFIALHIVNSTSGNARWYKGMPISAKGENHGIGLVNVENIIKKYNGSIILEEKNKIFDCRIVFNE